MTLYDSSVGTRRRGSDGRSKVLGTNLGGTMEWVNGFVPRNSGKFTWSGDDKELWNQVLRNLARDCVFGIGPSLSIMFNREIPYLMMCADIDAEVCEMWKPGQCMQLALTILEAYMEVCPSLRTEEGEEPRPLFVYSEPKEVTCKRVNCCGKCQSADLALRTKEDSAGPEATVLFCKKCGTDLDGPDAIITKSSFKVGCHLNGVQVRDETGERVIVEKSGAILTTQDHLFVRSLVISLWQKYSSQKAYLQFPFPEVIKKKKVIVDDISEGILRCDGSTATIIVPKKTGLRSGMHTVRCAGGDDGEEPIIAVMEMNEPRDVPPFPGYDSAEIIIDAAVLGSTRTPFNGMMRAPFVPKANKNCSCSNAELGIRECYLCGSSASQNRWFKVDDDRRTYITTHWLMSDFTVRPIGKVFGRFDWEVRRSRPGFHVGHVLRGNIDSLVGESVEVFGVEAVVEEVDAEGRVKRVRCTTSEGRLEYMFSSSREPIRAIGIMDTDGVVIEVFDRRVEHMHDILKQTCGYLPHAMTNVKGTPFVRPEKYAHMRDTFDISSEECDASRGVSDPMQQGMKKKSSSSHHTSVPIVTTNPVDGPMRYIATRGKAENIRNSKDPRYKTLRKILLRLWGPGCGPAGIYSKSTTLSASVTLSEPTWGKEKGRKRRTGTDKVPFYFVKIMNDRRCVNAMMCAKHPDLKRRPWMFPDGADRSIYCFECDPKAPGIHSQATPVFMKVDLDVKTGTPKVTLRCFSHKCGYHGKICNYSKECERVMNEESRKLQKFGKHIHRWHDLTQEEIRVLYPALYEAGGRKDAKKKASSTSSASLPKANNNIDAMIMML